MKIDQEYIDLISSELASGDLDRKSAKQKLADYSKESFNYDLNKQKSFKNMIGQLKEYLSTYKEPEIGQQEGVSIHELISAADQLDGKNVFNDAPEEALNLIKSVNDKSKTKKTIEVLVEKPVVIKQEDTPQAPVEDSEVVVIDDSNIQPVTYKLPEDFSPSIMMIGRAPGYYTLPWWIYKWILENEDWKDRPDDCPESSAVKILKSLIYYINRDGQVRIRETRNSRFITIK